MKLMAWITATIIHLWSIWYFWEWGLLFNKALCASLAYCHLSPFPTPFSNLSFFPPPLSSHHLYSHCLSAAFWELLINAFHVFLGGSNDLADSEAVMKGPSLSSQGSCLCVRCQRLQRLTLSYDLSWSHEKGEWDVGTTHYPPDQSAAFNVVLSLDKLPFQSNQYTERNAI